MDILGLLSGFRGGVEGGTGGLTKTGKKMKPFPTREPRAVLGRESLMEKLLGFLPFQAKDAEAAESTGLLTDNTNPGISKIPTNNGVAGDPYSGVMTDILGQLSAQEEEPSTLSRIGKILKGGAIAASYNNPDLQSNLFNLYTNEQAKKDENAATTGVAKLKMLTDLMQQGEAGRHNRVMEGISKERWSDAGQSNAKRKILFPLAVQMWRDKTKSADMPWEGDPVFSEIYNTLEARYDQNILGSGQQGEDEYR